jgi:hypothetical protein
VESAGVRARKWKDERMLFYSKSTQASWWSVLFVWKCISKQWHVLNGHQHCVRLGCFRRHQFLFHWQVLSTNFVRQPRSAESADYARTNDTIKERVDDSRYFNKRIVYTSIIAPNLVYDSLLKNDIWRLEVSTSMTWPLESRWCSCCKWC